MAKLFNKNITPACKYCIYGNALDFTENVICKHKGISNFNDSCRHYKYDPLKRKPTQVTLNTNYSSDDFSL